MVTLRTTAPIIVNFTSPINVPSAPTGKTKSGGDGGGFKALKLGQFALIDVEQRIAIGAGHALGLVRRDQIERPAAIRTAHAVAETRVRFTL